MSQVHASLDKERQFTQRLGEEAARTKAQLQGAMQSSATLAAQSAALEGQLGEERQARDSPTSQTSQFWAVGVAG